MTASSFSSEVSSRDAIQTFYDQHSTSPHVPHHVRLAIRNLLTATSSSLTTLPSKASAYQMAYTAIFPNRITATHQATGTSFSAQIAHARKHGNMRSEAAEKELQGLVTAMEDSIAATLVSEYATGHQC